MELDDRGLFVVFIQKEILSTTKDLEEALSKAKNYSAHLEATVRNFYEIESDEENAPLFALAYIKKHGRDNFDLTEEEFQEKISILTKKIEAMVNKGNNK